MVARIALPRRKPPVEKRWNVFYYDSLSSNTYVYSLPFSEIAANVPQQAWRFPGLEKHRYLWGSVLGLGALMMIALLVYFYPYFMVLGIMLGILIVPSMAGLGWLIGPAIARRSWVNQPFVKLQRAVEMPDEDDDDDDDDYDGDLNGDYAIKLQPMYYTGLTGVDPVTWREIVAENMEAIRQAAAEAGLEQVPQFDPVVNRADDAWEDIHGLLEREDTRIPMTTSQKIQLGSLAVMAFGSVFTGFFIVMATGG